MNKQNPIGPELNLAPRLKRPLSPWNPLDYLRLLFWVFFFPQALSHYINVFARQEEPKKRKKSRHTPERNLMVQAALLLLFAAAAAALGIILLGQGVDWLLLALGIIVGIVSGGIVGKGHGTAYGVSFGLTFGVTFAVGGNILKIFLPLLVNINPDTFPLFETVLGAALGAAAGAALNVAGCVKAGVDDDVIKGAVGGLFFIMAGGLIFAVTLVVPAIATDAATVSILTRNLRTAAFFSTALGTTFSLCIMRLPLYVPLALFAAMKRYIFRQRRISPLGRVVSLPLPGLRRQLENALDTDWEQGIRATYQILVFSLQYIPIIKALNNCLACSNKETLLPKVSTLVEGIPDMNVVRFCCTALRKQLRQKALDGLFFLLPGKIRPRLKKHAPASRTDTDARSACAGFWFLHRGETAEAVNTFAKLQDLTYGTEMYYIADALDKWFAINRNDKDKDTIQAIVKWEQETQRLEKLPDTLLRPATLKILWELREIAKNMERAEKAYSSFKKSQAAVDSISMLNQLTGEGEGGCPHPEWGLLKRIIYNCQSIIDRAGWKFSDDELKRPAQNLYEGFSGRPVTGATFRGRKAIIEEIENYWYMGNKIPTLILYGQRRIGKTSILRYMARNTSSSILLVYISIQKVGKVLHSGQFLQRFAEAICKVTPEAGISALSSPDAADYSDMGSACRAFNRLLDRLAPQMTGQRRLVLAIDEFEVIQEKIETKQIDAEILPYLRDLAQEYPWLGLIFAGLHTIEEMGRDYKQAFYGQAEYIRVSFLKREDAFDLIAHPKPPRFALDYSADLLDEIYRQTAGQPYLIQSLCTELVFSWNERFEEESEQTPRTLEVVDLPQVITADFFEKAEYYFQGVWDHITENERELMRIMAQKEGIWKLDELADAVNAASPLKNPGTFRTTLELLARHDIIFEDDDGIRFAGELNRRWVAKKNKKSA